MTTETWRAEAERRFPDLMEMIAKVDSPTSLWIELNFDFMNAYDTNRPDRVTAIYSYARWCCEQPRGQTAADDLGTIVCAGLYEDIPTHPGALKDMPNWWTLDDVLLMKQIFSYMVGEEGYAKVLEQFGQKSSSRDIA